MHVHAMKRRQLGIAMCLATAAAAAASAAPSPRPRTTTFALTHARVVDGTGGPARSDYTIVVTDGRITAIGPASAVRVPAQIETIDLTGRTAIPGLVGMHNHLFYQLEPAGSGPVVIAAPRTFAALYLAAGVTTIRTTGTIDLAADARVKARIERFRLVHSTAVMVLLRAGGGDGGAVFDGFARAGREGVGAERRRGRDRGDRPSQSRVGPSIDSAST
jgi:hypothetical protein